PRCFRALFSSPAWVEHVIAAKLPLQPRFRRAFSRAARVRRSPNGPKASLPFLRTAALQPSAEKYVRHSDPSSSFALNQAVFDQGVQGSFDSRVGAQPVASAEIFR